jgi:lipopolysaccharide/colanic/teichoic acid biosynthesis glycosyltransferase
MIKRLFDIFFSLFGLILVSPILFIIAILIKSDSRGPVFYRGIRIGRYEKPFRIFKFRTMVPEAEKLGGPSTAADDPRLTKIGKFLKRFQLDELPQLINVLKGEMSLVGPRPEVPTEVATYNEEEKKLLSIRPGMTDWASLWNFHEGEILEGSKDSHQTYREKIKPKKIELGLKYVESHSLLVDIEIIIKTVSKIFS